VTVGCEEVRLDLSALLSGELDAGEMRRVNSHLAECKECSRELVELRDTIALLVRAPMQDEPAAELEHRVFELAALEPLGSMVSAAPLETQPPVDLEARSLVRAGVFDSIVAPRTKWAKVSMVLVPGLAAAAVAIGLVATQWHTRVDQLESLFGPMGDHVATQQLTGLDTANAASAEIFDSDHRNYHLVLHAEHLPLTPSGYHYELWLSSAEGSISAGSFRVMGPEDSVFPFTIGVNPRDYPHFELSLEPDDGNPAHTGETIVESNYTP
jgi:anti-sigma-K factor RskA/putative zinc finger protein